MTDEQKGRLEALDSVLHLFRGTDVPPPADVIAMAEWVVDGSIAAATALEGQKHYPHGGHMTETVRSLGEPWRSWLGQWRDVLDPDLPVYFYSDDGSDTPDQWADEPHVAVCVDAVVGGEPRGVVWPVHVPGWADPTSIGWEGVFALLAANQREDT